MKLSSFRGKETLNHLQLSNKNRTTSLWHWSALFLFGVLILTTPTKHLLVLALLIGIVALIKGPGMLLLGMIYSFFVGMFPFLGVVLSLLFFIINIRTLSKNWRINFVGAFYFLYPLSLMIAQHFFTFNRVSLVIALTFGLITLHILLTRLYQTYGTSQRIIWYIWTIPYELLLLLIPTRLKKGNVNKSFHKKTR
ncbi:MAG: hypothetical protein ACK5NA_05350 [Enterococcus sp.]